MMRLFFGVSFHMAHKFVCSSRISRALVYPLNASTCYFSPQTSTNGDACAWPPLGRSLPAGSPVVPFDWRVPPCLPMRRISEHLLAV